MKTITVHEAGRVETSEKGEASALASGRTRIRPVFYTLKFKTHMLSTLKPCG
jgi:hypothetical protein